jgi:beta-lactamase superfamily II metal-dependent hydrolase
MKRQSILLGFVMFFLLLDAGLFYDIFLPAEKAGFYFLDVGEGDSELIILPDGAKILIDAGPDGHVLEVLQKIIPAYDHYIDLAILTYPQPAHFGGFGTVIDHYGVGSFIWNGQNSGLSNQAWLDLLSRVQKKKIPIENLFGGDVIRFISSEIKILSPSFGSADGVSSNDLGYVLSVETPAMRGLFMADVDQKIERKILASGARVRADVLKISHYGSKSSSGEGFLRAVDPSVVVIEVGAGNRYRYPSSETLARIASSTHAQIFRTDQAGSIAFYESGMGISVKTEK